MNRMPALATYCAMLTIDWCERKNDEKQELGASLGRIAFVNTSESPRAENTRDRMLNDKLVENLGCQRTKQEDWKDAVL